MRILNIVKNENKGGSKEPPLLTTYQLFADSGRALLPDMDVRDEA